jgi:hypothetical protein
VAFTPASTFRVELNGANPGTGYDQLNVHGNVSLANCLLSPSLGFAPAVGSSFVIINNGGTNPIGSTFGGLPEGTLFPISGMTFSITYAGSGSGNNVLLLRTNAPASLVTSFATVTNGQAQLQGTGISNLAYIIQASTNLRDWGTIGSVVADGSGLFSFSDTNAPLFTTRFYRVCSP